MPTVKKPVGLAKTKPASTRATLRAPDPDEVEIPPLSARPDGAEWHPMTLEWWGEIWYSPMAAEWCDADTPALYRLAVLIDNFHYNPTTSASAEIRLCQQAFGLTPYDRRRLEWTIEQTEDAKDRGASRRRSAQVPQPSAGNDPRLRIVE